MSSSTLGSMMPFSVNNDSSAATRSSIGLVARGWWCAADSALIDRFHVALPQVHVNGIAGLTPELVALEPDAVRRIIPATRRMRLDVRHGSDDVDPHHGSPPPAHVSWASRMPGWMPVAHPHLLTDDIAGRDDVVAGIVGGHATVATRQWERATGSFLELSGGHHPGFDKSRGEPGDPVLVVGRLQVVRGLHALNRVTGLAAVAQSREEAAKRNQECSTFPGLVERRLVDLHLHRAEPLHPTEIVHAVHRAHWTTVRDGTPVRPASY